MMIFVSFQTAHDVVKVDGRQDENAGVPKKAFNGKPRNQPFTIYVDQDSDMLPPPQGHAAVEDLEVDDDLENQLPSLNEAVMRLPSIPQPPVRVPEAKGELLWFAVQEHIICNRSLLPSSRTRSDGDKRIDTQQNNLSFDETKCYVSSIYLPTSSQGARSLR